jgi:site-specific DNA-cytosine methylase
MLTLLSSDRPANRSASPANGSDWMIRVATWPSSPFALLAASGPAGWFSRTSPAYCRVTADGTLEPSSGSWGNAGMGSPTAFLTLSISGVPQRRARVFVVGYLGDWRPPAAVLFERESLRGDTPPRREAGQATARPVGSCAAGGSGYRNESDTAENLIAFHGSQDPNISGSVSHPLGRQHNGMTACIAFGGNRQSGPVDVATAVNAHGGPHWRLDFESETFVASIVPPLTGNHYGDHESREGLLVAHSLRADGFDASEDGTGRGTPLITHALTAPTGRGSVTEDGTGRGTPLTAAGMSVRRLTPVECERLQGFPGIGLQSNTGASPPPMARATGPSATAWPSR